MTVHVAAVLAAGLAGSAAALAIAPRGTSAPLLGADERLWLARGWPALLVVLLAGGWWLSRSTDPGLPLRLVGPGAVLVAASGGVLALRQAGVRRSARHDTAARVLEACEEIAGELSAGVAPGQALERAAVRWPALSPVASAQRFGGSVPHALRALSGRPGAGDLALIAAAWQLTERSGGGLAEALASVAEGLRQQQRTRRVVAAELSSARATARLIAVLPALTLATGSGVGSPLGFLFGTPAGLLCLAGGLCLGFLGLGWLERIAAALEQET